MKTIKKVFAYNQGDLKECKVGKHKKRVQDVPPIFTQSTESRSKKGKDHHGN